jgi:glutamate synthase domain-containing protein 3
MFIAQEVRELMSLLGFRRFEHMVGRADRLERRRDLAHLEERALDLGDLLFRPPVPHTIRFCQYQPRELDDPLERQLVVRALPALERREPVRIETTVTNVQRTVGTMLGSEVSRRFGEEGMPDDTITLHLVGTAGQSLGAFLPRGITIVLDGDANDYVGKGLSGGKIVVRTPQAPFAPDENVLVGNVCLYGATGGEAYINGVAGERFAVRNGGATAVVEGVGDHGCEYMTGGRVVVLGGTGRNFAAGMSGGIAYVLDERGDFAVRCNPEMVGLGPLSAEGEREVRLLVGRHAELTGSVKARRVLRAWDEHRARFVEVMPEDYRQALVGGLALRIADG